MKTNLSILVLFLVIVCANCAQEAAADSSHLPELSPTPQIFKAEAKIGMEQLEDVKTTKTILNSKENYSKVYFVDEKTGWLVGDIVSEDDDLISSKLYKTEDGGKSWQNSPLKVEKEAGFANAFFINRSTGWINIQKYGDVTGKISKSRLMRTSDGGKSWQELAVQNFTVIREITFIDEKHGWITGSTENPENVYDSKEFFRKTSDGGNSWVEIGEKLFKQNGFEDRDARQNITGVIAETPEKIKVVMWSGKFFETSDGGEKWKQFGPQFDLPMQTIPNNFGKLGNSNRLRLANGTWSIEGIYSYIATEKNGDWTLRWTDKPLCIYEILFLSENEMIVAGRLSVSQLKKDYREDGLILYSSDAGENWKTVYRSESVSEINSIAKVSENKFIAVGAKGLIINIEIQK